MALNPFRSEAEAYRFVWLTIGYFGLIVAGAVINKWLGLAVFIVLSAVVLFFYFRRGERRTRVLAPTRARTAEDEQARDAAQGRLERSLARLNDAGIEARGEIGDGEPLQAIEDALRTFGADEVIISTHPEGRSNWLEKGVVSGARERFAVPITHVVVDLERESEEVR